MAIVTTYATSQSKVTLIRLLDANGRSSCVWIEGALGQEDEDRKQPGNCDEISNPSPGELFDYLVNYNGSTRYFSLQPLGIGHSPDVQVSSADRFCSAECSPTAKACEPGLVPKCYNVIPKLRCDPPGFGEPGDG
jgi:hypothetical protein